MEGRTAATQAHARSPWRCSRCVLLQAACSFVVQRADARPSRRGFLVVNMAQVLPSQEFAAAMAFSRQGNLIQAVEKLESGV